MGTLVSRILQVVTRQETTSSNYDNLEDIVIGETALLAQPSTSKPTNRGKRNENQPKKERTSTDDNNTTQPMQRSLNKQEKSSQRNILNIIKLPKLKSLSKPLWVTRVTKTTTATTTSVVNVEQGGDRIAALKQRLFEKQNQQKATTKRPKRRKVKMVLSASEGHVAKSRRSLDKIFNAPDNFAPTLYPLFSKPKKNFDGGKPTLSHSLSTGACEMAKFF